MEDNYSKLYKAMVNSGYDIADLGGSEDDFRREMQDSTTRKNFYDWVSNNEMNGFRIGSYDAYEERLAPTQTVTAPQVEAEPQQGFFTGVKAQIADAAKQAMQKPRGGENGYTFTAEELGIEESNGNAPAAPVELQYDGTKPVVPGMAKEGDIPGIDMEAYNANMAKAMAEGKVLSPGETQRRFEEREAEVAARLPQARARMNADAQVAATMKGAFDRAYGAAKGVYYADEAERLTKGLLDEYSAERAKRLSQVEKDVENYNSARRWAVSNPYATDAYSEVAYRSNATKLRNADELGMMEEFAKDAKKRLLADENLKAKAEENAELLGMPVERYINEVAVPIMQERMYSEWLAPQEERAKRNYNGFAAAAEGSLIGTLLGATRTDTEKYLSQVGQEAWRKNASLLGRAAAGAGSMFLDLPVFMGAGSLAAQPAKAVGGQVFKQLAKNETKRLVARGVTEGAAQRYASYAVRNGLKNRILLNLSTAPLQSGLTFGMFDAGKAALNMSLNGEWDWKELGKSAVGGTLMGGALGATGAVGGGLTHGLTGATKAAAKVAEFGVENAVFTEGGRLIGKLHGEQPENGWLEDYVESGATLLMIKAPNIVKNVSAIKGDKEASEVFAFNRLEREQLGKYGEDLNAVLESLLPKSGRLYEDGLKINEGTFTEEYRRVMSDPEVSMTTKAKLMGIVEGKMMPAPKVVDAKIEGNRVMTYDPMGRLVEVKEYATEAKANAEYKKVANAAEVESIAVMEDMYMRIKGYEADDVTVREWLAKNPTVTAEDIANIIAKNSAGEKLTEGEQKILDSLRKARHEGLNDVRFLNDVLAELNDAGVDVKAVMSGIEKPIDERTEAENRAVKAYTDVLYQEIKAKVVEPFRRGEARRAEDVDTTVRLIESDRSVDETANDGVVYTTTTPSGEKIIITGGKVVLDNEGYIDVNQSEGLVAMFPDGQKKPVRPGDLREKVEVSNAEEMKAVKREEIEQEIAAENGWKPIEVGAEYDVVFDGDAFRVKVEGRDENGDVIISGEGASMAVPESFLQDAMKQAEAVGEMPIATEPVVAPVESTVPTAEEVADAQAFADAYAANTMDAYQNYLDKFPEGAYREGARRGIWALEGTSSVADIASITNAENVLQRAATNEVQPEVAPVVEDQIGDNTEKVVEPADEAAAPVVEAPKTALEQIPRNENNIPLYEQVDSELAWDGVVEEAGGNEETAMVAVNSMVEDKKKALAAAEKAKAKAGATITEKIAAENERVANIERAKADLAKWEEIAGVKAKRALAAEAESKRVADEAAAKQRAEEERLRAEREEAERAEREALNGVPDMVDDKPQDARARGYRRVNGHKVDRQEPVQGLMGKEIAVKFSDSSIPTGRVAVIEAEQLQPSHIQGQRNPLHFIDEAQPKERNDAASVLSARKIAENVRPEEITSSVTAYTGAPTVNTRGEAVQGNNRSAALRLMWENNPEQAAKYKQYLMDHAAEFGLNAEDVAAMKSPVLVNMLDVSDADAITLGQYVAQDTESGGTERIKPKNVMQKMGGDMRSFANKLLASNNEEASFAELVDANGVEVLKWMAQKGYITPTQYKSAFDSKGNLTAEVKNDLRDVMYQSIFKGGSTQLEEMFNALPAKAQKAILATAFRDYDSPNAERMNGEVQNSIRAYYALARDAAFANAKNYKEAKEAAMMWARQYQLDDVSGESFLPSENFSNFAIELAVKFKGETQKTLQNLFNNIYDLIQGTKQASLFEEADNTPRTLKEAIKETFNIDYNGQYDSNSLAGGNKAGQPGRQGTAGSVATGERIEGGERPADSTGGTRGNGEVSSPEIPNNQIPGLKGYTTDEVLNLTKGHITDILGRDISIVDMRVIGSRSNGTNSENSDLDVLVEFDGDISEDAFFNAVNGEDALYIDGVRVDINPITKDKSGTIEQWMNRNAGYSKTEGGNAPGMKRIPTTLQEIDNAVVEETQAPVDESAPVAEVETPQATNEMQEADLENAEKGEKGQKAVEPVGEKYVDPNELSEVFIPRPIERNNANEIEPPRVTARNKDGKIRDYYVDMDMEVGEHNINGNETYPPLEVLYDEYGEEFLKEHNIDPAVLPAPGKYRLLGYNNLGFYIDFNGGEYFIPGFGVHGQVRQMIEQGNYRGLMADAMKVESKPKAEVAPKVEETAEVSKEVKPGAEADRIAEAFDNFFATVEEKTEDGQTVLFQQGMIELDRENPAFERATENVRKKLEATGVKVKVLTKEEAEKALAELGADAERQTSKEIEAKYPNWLEGTTTESGKHSTQVEGTRKTYGKVGTWIEQNLGKNVSILDASSGMGYGTADLRERGFNIEDVEPYQSEERKQNNPATYSSYEDIDKQYDYIISNAVLNVIPDDWRTDVLHNMADKLKVGGKLFINTRKAGEERSIKDKIELDSPREVLVKRNGRIASYQRFFTPQELKEWVENELGEGYSVEIANEKNSGTKGLAAVVVTKNNESPAKGKTSELGQPISNHKGMANAPLANVSAKVGKNTERANRLDAIISSIEDIGEMGPHEFLHEVVNAMLLSDNISTDVSRYAKLGGGVTLRLADHYGNAETFKEHKDQTENYGLVIKLSNQIFKPDNNVDYLEYVYFPDKLTKERQIEIAKGLKAFMETGRYDLLPKPDKVNPSGKFKDVEFLRTSDGTTYGWAVNGEIYLTPEGLNPNTPIHEYTHLWAAALQKSNPKLWGEVVEAMKLSPAWNEVMADDNYTDIHGDENRVASEVLSRLSGNEGYRRYMEQAEAEIAAERDIVGKVQKKGILNRIKNAVSRFWNWLKGKFGSKAKAGDGTEAKAEPWDVFVNKSLKDFDEGVNPDAKDSPLDRMFIGKKGAANLDKAEEATTRLDNLNVAREMETAGKDAKAIKLATGWERGADGKWRYEVMDDFELDLDANVAYGKRNPEVIKRRNRWRELLHKGNALAFEGELLSADETAEFESLSAEFKGTQLHNSRTLKDYIDAPELFEAYPEVADIKVSIEALDENEKGSYSPIENIIRLNNELGKGEIKSTLNHEIQHSIQYIEGFARGGNTEDVLTRAQALRGDVRPLYDMMLETPEWAEKKRLVNRWLAEEDKTEPDRDYQAQLWERIEEINNSGVLDDIQQLQDRFIKKYGLDRTVTEIISGPYAMDAEVWSNLPESFYDKYDAYKRLAGEVEARNVQKRMGMTAEERRNSLAEETYMKDVAKEDQTFIFDNLGVSSSQEVAPEQDIPVGEVESKPISRIDLSNGPVKGINEPEWKFKARREKWKRWVESNTSVKIPMPEKPFLQEGESIEEYEARMKEFNKELNKWKKDILSNESEIEKMMDILYEGKMPEMNPTPEDEFTEQVFRRYMGDDGIKVDRKSMRGMIMDEIIERRRKIETNNFDDVVFIDKVRKATTAEQRKAIPFIIEGTYNGKVTPELAAVVNRIRDWFENVYQALQAADAMHSSGKIKNYVTHIWDKERTPKAVYENYISTRSKYTNRRSIETYAEGIALGMVPKYDDICDIMLEYGHIANEAIANKDFTDFLHMLRVDGEPVLKDATIRDPMYVRTSAEALDGYKVHKYAKGIVETVLGNIRTENAAAWMQKLAHFYDMTGSLMKKINLSLSFFHHGALIETAVGAMGPAKTISTVFKNLVWDCMRSGELPALSNPEAARNAVNHLVQLGATQDYMAKEVNRLTGQLKGWLQDFSDRHPNFATKSIVKPAELLDFLNTGFDKVLWDYLHDGLKIYTFDKYAKEIEEYCKKKGVDDTTKDMLLNEVGQFVNDTFGGQFWELINQSPATVKWMRRLLLSPDWTVSTIRQALAPLGFGTLYKDYEKNWFKRTFSGIPEAVTQRRKMGAKFWIIAMLTFVPLMNALNAWRRKDDVDEELKKAEERRITDPEYKSPYELKYPEGMKWYDYTMYGNTIGHQTHLFGWRYDDDKEGYIRWGKQFRELPELFLGKDGFSFPGPMIDKMVGKANPALSASLAFLGYAKDGWQSKWMKDKKGWEKELGRVMMMAASFMPYSIPTDEDKEFRLTDLMMPSSKGFSNYKAIREFETAILAQDFDYVGAVYDACVMNKLDAEKLLQAAIARVEAQAKAEYVEGANTLNEAWDKYQEDLDVNEKRAIRAKFNKLLQENAYKDFEKQEARDMVQSVLDGTYREEKLPDAYIASETAEDVRDAYKMDAIRLRLKKVVDDIPEDAEAYKQYYKDNEAKIDLYDETVAAKREINLIMEDIKIYPQQTELFMQEIRDIRKEVIELANNLTSNNE